jgi:Zn-dependent alcohol dehydrogenase
VGGVGVNALLAAALAGAQTVIAIDANPAKREVALASGATHFINAGSPDALEEIRALTKGRGVDHAIESTGHPRAMALAYDITRPAGAVVIIGIAPVGTDLAIPAIGFPGSKKRIIGSIYGGGVPEQDINRILTLYSSGRLPLDRQIGERIPLARINEAFRWLEEGVPARTVILPN